MKKIICVSVIALSIVVIFGFFSEYRTGYKYKTEVEKTVSEQKPMIINQIDKIYDNSEKIYIDFTQKITQPSESKEKMCNTIFKDYLFKLEDNGRLLESADFDIYIKLIEITKKYTEIKEEVPSTDFSGTLYDFLYPYFKKYNVDTDNLDEISEYNALKEEKLNGYIQEIHSYCR